MNALECMGRWDAYTQPQVSAPPHGNGHRHINKEVAVFQIGMEGIVGPAVGWGPRGEYIAMSERHASEPSEAAVKLTIA